MNVDDFVKLVREYKALVDNVDGSGAHEFLSSCANILPRVYAAGIVLPDVEPESEEIGDSIESDESDESDVAALLGRYDFYFLVFDPCFDGERVAGQISGDVAEIYADLVNPLIAFEAGRVNDAVWEWKFNIRGHCGDHIVNTMKAIHRLVHDHMPVDYVADASG